MIGLALQVALESDVTDQALRGYFNLAEHRLSTGAPEEAGELLGRGLMLARERGYRSWEQDLVAQRVGVHAFSGQWDEALALSESLNTEGETGIIRLAAVFAPLILSARGDLAGLDAWLAAQVQPSEWHELAVVEGIAKGVALRAAGRTDDAMPLITLAPEENLLGGLTHMFYLGDVLEALIESGQDSVVEELLANRVHVELSLTRGQLQRASGLLQAERGELQRAEAEFAEAVVVIEASGNPFALARAMLDHGRILLELRRTEEATAVLRRARSMFERLRAKLWIERTDHLLRPAALAAD